jgi:hypothetical protein
VSNIERKPVVLEAGEPEVVWHDSALFFVGYAAVMGGLTTALMTIPSGVFPATLTGLNMAWAVLRLLWRRPRLRVTDEGVVDENFWYSGGLLPWSSIRDIRPTRWGLIQVELFEEDTYFKCLHPLKALALLKMQLYGFPPVVLIPWGLEGSRRDVVAQLQDGLDQWAVAAAGRGELAGPTVDEG